MNFARVRHPVSFQVVVGAVVSAVVVHASGCGDVAIRVGTLPSDERPLVCRDLPSDVPSPVKLLVAVDTSGSMAFTDPEGRRFAALADYVAENSDTPNLFIHTLGFDELVSEDTAGFVPVAEWQTPTFAARGGFLTDHQGMLEHVHDVIEADMRALSDEERARTRYVVTILTDGGATPICCIAADETISDGSTPTDACPLESWESPAPAGTVTCEGASEQGNCNDAAFLASFREASPGALATFDVGGDRNRESQLRAAVDAIVALGRDLDAGDVDVNAALLFDPLLSDDVRQLYGLNECRLTRAATVLDAEQDPAHFRSAADIDFAVFEARPICEPLAGSCKNICTGSLQQLQDDFGFPADVCEGDAFAAAGDDCAACEDAFAALGVDAAVCAD